MLKLSDINKSFNLDDQKVVALKDVSFEVEKGEFFTIIGPSGCGKSTLLRILAGLSLATSGKVIWEGDQILSFVFQNYALFPFLTVFENIEFGLKMKGENKAKRKKIVDDLIAEMELTEFADKHPKELSGGMKQRVGIARALALSPTVLLLDEPFSSLDEFTAEVLRKLLLDVWKKRKITVIMVTHLAQEAIQLSNRILVMTPAPGQVEQIVDNKLARPRNLRSREFFNFEDQLLKLIKV